MVDEPLHVFGLVDSPGVDLQAKAMALFYPFGVLAEDLEVIVGSGTSPVLEGLRVGITLQVVDGCALRGEAYELAGGVAREGDVLCAFVQSQFVYHPDDALDGTGLLFGRAMGLQFEDESGVECAGTLQVLAQGGQGFAIVQADSGADSQGGILDGDAPEGVVVVHHQLVVTGEPDIKLRAVAADRVGLHQGGEGVLCRAGRLPEATVGNDLCLLLGLTCVCCWACAVPKAASNRADVSRISFSFIIVRLSMDCGCKDTIYGGRSV